MANPKFRKDLLYPGKGEMPLYQKDTKVNFHFRTFRAKLAEEYFTKPSQEDIIDDTRTMGCGPFELLIGREFKLSIWEEMVKTMKLSEVSRFTCQFLSIIDYSTVSKALRDIALKNAGKPVPPRAHQCSFSVMKGTGHRDLDKIIEDAAPLSFEFELLSIEHPGSYKQDHWAMSNKEKSSAIVRLRTEGNSLYNEDEYLLASKKYFEALSYLEEQLIQEKPQSDSWFDISMKKVPFLLNYVQCKWRMEDYAEVIRHTTVVLEIDPDNIKALFRRGRAYSAAWDAKEAEQDLKRAAQLDPKLGKVVDNELASLKERVKEKDDAERERLKGKMF